MTAVERTRTTRTAPAENVPLVPFPSDAAPGDPALSDPAPGDAAVFRFPAEDDPAPGTRRMLAMALYGTALGLAGVGVGLYAVVAVFGGAPGWYLPVLALLTLLSVVPTAAAFLAIHQRNLPWYLLLAAAPPMAAAVAVALAY